MQVLLVISSSNPYIISNDSGICGAVVTFEDLFTDDCDFIAEDTSGILSGSIFPVGTSTVVLVATDFSGNVSLTTTVEIIVNDTEAPVTDLSTLENVTAECEVTSLTAPTATDNCGGMITVTNDATLPITQKGTTVVTWTYTDGEGNTSTQTQNVMINDITLPTIDCPNDLIVTEEENGSYMILDYSKLVNDNCTDISQLLIMQEPIAGAVLTEPDTINISIEVADNADNTNTCTFQLVLDEILNLDDVSSNNLLVVYPTLFTDVLSIETKIQIGRVSVYDLQGRKIKDQTFEVTATHHQVNLSGVEDGEYILYLYSKTGVITQKIIKE